MQQGKTVFVGLSGGVDSSVAALRLKSQGYDVFGVFIKVWHPDFLECNWEQERLDAMRVAAKLDIPFLTCDAENAYKNDVADYFIAEYKAGRTPNPDVMCNKYVKFGAFLDFARQHNADYVATGHYAQKIETDGVFQLHRGIDTNKDQSYFLWTLTQEQLQHILLPVGNSTKDAIRKEAQDAGLITAEKKDSQGICFLGHIDIPEFLSHYIDLQKGDVLNTEGQVIGTHKGALVYTRGQRHGFTLNTQEPDQEALYVIERNIEKNTITVSNTKPVVQKQETLCLQECNFIGATITVGEELTFQSRYRQKPTKAIVTEINVKSMTLKMQEQTEGISAGQSCVLYRGTVCLGGGIIA